MTAVAKGQRVDVANYRQLASVLHVSGARRYFVLHRDGTYVVAHNFLTYGGLLTVAATQPHGGDGAHTAARAYELALQDMVRLAVED